MPTPTPTNDGAFVTHNILTHNITITRIMASSMRAVKSSSTYDPPELVYIRSSIVCIRPPAVVVRAEVPEVGVIAASDSCKCPLSPLPVDRMLPTQRPTWAPLPPNGIVQVLASRSDRTLRVTPPGRGSLTAHCKIPIWREFGTLACQPISDHESVAVLSILGVVFLPSPTVRAHKGLVTML